MNLYTTDPTLGAASTPEDYGSLSSGWALGEAADQAWQMSGLDSLLRASAQYQQRYGQSTRAGTYMFQPGAETPLLSAGDANSRYGIQGELSWDKPVRAGEAELLNQWKREELTRNDALDRSTPGFIPGAARFLTGLAVSAADPVNLAAGMVPVFGEARWAELAASIGKPLTRVARGAAEGLVGSALVEPITGLQQIHQQGDYTLDTALMDIGFGTIAGAGLRFLGGAAGDLARRWMGTPEMVREGAFFHAMNAVTEGAPVRAAEITEPARIFAATRQDRLLSSTSLTPFERETLTPREALEGERVPLHDPDDPARADWEDRIEGAAREAEPEAWGQRDQLLEQQDQLRQQMEAETATRDGGAALADLDAKIEYARGRMYDAPYRDRRFYQDQLNRLYAERDAAAGTKLRGADTPAMADIRQKLTGIDLALRDLAPKISASLERGRAETPRPDHAETAMFNHATDPLDSRHSMTGPVERPATLDDLMAQTRDLIRREARGETGASDAAIGAEASRRADTDVAGATPPARSGEQAKVLATEAEQAYRALQKDAETRGTTVTDPEIEADLEAAGTYQAQGKAAALMADCIVREGV